MTNTLPPYPQTKESGVPWLGEIPAHWETRKLRHIMTSVTERNRPDFPLLSVVREKGVILRDVSSSDENHNYIPDDLSNYKVVRQGQFAMNKMKAWQGSFGVSSYDGIVSPAYYVFALTGVEGGFFHTALRSRAYIPFFTQASDGVRIGQWDLSKTRMREIPFFVPPLAEQTAIARYLDYVDRRVRRYIKAKRRLIEVLTEQKQAIIHQAVTRGLDPDVPMKESGVAWLGEVPAHWEVRNSKTLFKNRKERARPDDQQLTASQEYGIINQSEFMFRAGRRVMPVIKGSDILKHVEPNDFVISMRTFQGGIELSRVGGAISSAYVMLIPDETVYPQFFSYLFKSSLYIEALSSTSNLVRDGQALRFANFAQVPLPIFETNEQRAIADYLDRFVARIDNAITITDREIQLLREYRTRLIADVVTGKVDVRGVAAALGEEAGFDMPLDKLEDRSADQDEAWGDEEEDEELNQIGDPDGPAEDND